VDVDADKDEEADAEMATANIEGGYIPYVPRSRVSSSEFRALRLLVAMQLPQHFSFSFNI